MIQIKTQENPNEVFGFYHKNKYGKRLLNCNLNKNDIISGSTDSSDLIYVDNSIIIF